MIWFKVVYYTNTIWMPILSWCYHVMYYRRVIRFPVVSIKQRIWHEGTRLWWITFSPEHTLPLAMGWVNWNALFRDYSSRIQDVFRKTYWFSESQVSHLSKDNDNDDVIKWKYFPRCWPFVRGIHRSPMNSPHKGQWCRSLMFSLICAWINGWVNNRETGDMRRNCVPYDFIVIFWRIYDRWYTLFNCIRTWHCCTWYTNA